MFDLYFLVPVYTIAVAILCVRRGQTMPWLWIILFTGPIGATIYLVVEFAGLAPRSLGDASRRRQGALARLRADAVRLDTVGGWADLASAEFDRRNFRTAITAAERALARSPAEIEARYVLGRSRLALGDPAAAVAALGEVVAAEPDHANGEARFALAVALRAAGDLAAARSHLAQLADQSSRADFLFEYADVLMQAGDPAAARPVLRRIVDEFVYVPAFMRSRVRPWVWRARWRLARLGR